MNNYYEKYLKYKKKYLKLKEKINKVNILVGGNRYIEYYEKELYDCKKSLETLKEKSKHLFGDT